MKLDGLEAHVLYECQILFSVELEPEPFRNSARMKKRVKRGRLLMVAGLFLLLGTTLFRALPSLDWTVSTATVFLAFGLMVIGVLLAHP
jgi:hypothetical protein